MPGNRNSEDLEDRRRRAMELHLAGASYDQIAEVLGYANRGGAYKAVQAALEETGPMEGEEEITTQIARLNAMLQGLWPRARKGDAGAVDRVLKIDERRTQLLTRLGLIDEPQSEDEAGDDAGKETSLSDFQQRLLERQQRAASPDRPS